MWSSCSTLSAAESVTPKLAVKRGVSPGCAAARSRAGGGRGSSTAWKRSSSGNTITNSSPPQRAIRSFSRSAPRRPARTAGAPIAGLVPVVSLSCLNLSRSAITTAKGRAACEQLAQLLLGRAPVHKPGEPVGRGLQLGLFECPHGPDSSARPVRRGPKAAKPPRRRAASLGCRWYATRPGRGP